MTFGWVRRESTPTHCLHNNIVTIRNCPDSPDPFNAPSAFWDLDQKVSLSVSLSLSCRLFEHDQVCLLHRPPRPMNSTNDFMLSHSMPTSGNPYSTKKWVSDMKSVRKTAIMPGMQNFQRQIHLSWKWTPLSPLKIHTSVWILLSNLYFSKRVWMYAANLWRFVLSHSFVWCK